MSESETIARTHYEETRKANPDRPAWNRLDSTNLHHMKWKQEAFREAHRIIAGRRGRNRSYQRLFA